MKKSREVLESGRIAQVQTTKIAERIDLLLERLVRLTKLNFRQQDKNDLQRWDEADGGRNALPRLGCCRREPMKTSELQAATEASRWRRQCTGNARRRPDGA
jgi:hypothetical protein